MNEAPLVCVIDDKADLSAIRKVLDCARDRTPKVTRENVSENTSILEMTWVRVDSPKREAALRISSFEAQKVRPGSAEDMRLMAVEVLERALSDDPAHSVSQEMLDGWHKDLRMAAAYAATLQHDSDPRISRVDLCHASAGTAWADAIGDRPGEKGNKEIIPILDADRIARLLPDLPRIVLVRGAKTNRAGRSLVNLGALHGSTDFMDLSIVERLRLDSLFRPLDA